MALTRIVFWEDSCNISSSQDRVQPLARIKFFVRNVRVAWTLEKLRILMRPS